MDWTDVGAATKGHDELFICYPLTLIHSKLPGCGLCSLSFSGESKKKAGKKSTQVNYSSQGLHLIEEAQSLQHVAQQRLKKLG